MKYFFPEDSIFHCPICGRELIKKQYTESGWLCKCGEFIPEGLAINAFLGSTERINPHYNKKNIKGIVRLRKLKREMARY